MFKKLSDSIIINRPINDVWDEVTNPENFYSFNLESHTKVHQGKLRGGDRFTWHGNKGGESTLYVVELVPPHYFGWGGEPDSIDFSFELTQLGSETEIRYSRIYDHIINKKELQEYIRIILTSIKKFCENKK